MNKPNNYNKWRSQQKSKRQVTFTLGIVGIASPFILTILEENKLFYPRDTSIYIAIGAFIVGLFLVIYTFFIPKSEKIYNKLIAKDKNETNKHKENVSKSRKRDFETRIQKLKKIKSEYLFGLQKIKIQEAKMFKEFVYGNEKAIQVKSDDNGLLKCIKIINFLDEYRAEILSELSKSIEDLTQTDMAIKALIQDFNREQNSIDILHERFTQQGKTKIEALVDRLIALAPSIVAFYDRLINEFLFYEGYATAMIKFLLSDKKLRYYEIMEAFEKLGVFDSTWQKNIGNKLNALESKLDTISSGLDGLNKNFNTLFDSNERIIDELRSIDNSIGTSNIIQAITAYQTYRINKNTKE